MASAKRKARSEETAPGAAPAAPAPEPKTKPRPRPKGRARPKPPEWDGNHVVDCPTPGLHAILDIVDGIDPRPEPKDLGEWLPWLANVRFSRLGLEGPIDGQVDLQVRIYTERHWRTLCAEFGDDLILDGPYDYWLHAAYPVLCESKNPTCPFRFTWRSAHRIRRFGLVLVVEYTPELPPIKYPGPRWKPRVRRRAADEE